MPEGWGVGLLRNCTFRRNTRLTVHNKAYRLFYLITDHSTRVHTGNLKQIDLADLRRIFTIALEFSARRRHMFGFLSSVQFASEIF